MDMNRLPEAHRPDTDESLRYTTPTIVDYGVLGEVTAGSGGHRSDFFNVSRVSTAV